MIADMHPFLFAASISRDAGDNQTTRGIRGGVAWGRDETDARGRLAAGYLADGWTVESVHVAPMDAATLGNVAAYAAAAPDAA